MVWNINFIFSWIQYKWMQSLLNTCKGEGLEVKIEITKFVEICHDQKSLLMAEFSVFKTFPAVVGCIGTQSLSLISIFSLFFLHLSFSTHSVSYSIIFGKSQWFYSIFLRGRTIWWSSTGPSLLIVDTIYFFCSFNCNLELKSCGI